MENSNIDVVNNRVKEYVDYVFNEYITNVTCPKSRETYKDWFVCEFLPCCITKWYEPSCYNTHNIFTVEEFFCNSIHVFSEILQLLSDYFHEYHDKFNPENVMRCYISFYISKNIEYFLDRFQYDDFDDFDESNPRSETSDNLSLDNTLIENNHQDNTENNIEDSEGETTIDGYDSDEDDDTNTSSLPVLINIIDDDDDSYEGDNIYEDELYETGVFVSEEEFVEKNKNEECFICLDIIMNHYNSMKWNNCNHFSCIYCHDECMKKQLYKCPLCRM
jgi:hypothetical protein